MSPVTSGAGRGRALKGNRAATAMMGMMMVMMMMVSKNHELASNLSNMVLHNFMHLLTVPNAQS